MARKYQPPVLTPGWVEYLRTSDEDVQAPERSQASQSRLNHERLITPSGLPCLGKYADIFTGKSIDRRNYQRLLADARLGKFSHVAIAFVDRFGRNDVEGLRAFDELVALGIQIRIATYPSLDPSKPDGRMIVGVLFNMARFESDRIGERCREGMRTKILEGGWAWHAPDGYLNVEMKSHDLERPERLKHARYKRWVVTDPAQFPVWRLAWDLLLEDTHTLADICEILHARGYRLHTGRPFIEMRKGRRVAVVKALSKAFHNWFYAGWVVVDNQWATIPPKEVRGHWEPVVTTEEFELGEAILRERNNDREHKARHFYLLQGLIYLQKADGKLVKLTCGTPNANRERGGVAYYCIPSSNANILCHVVDGQIPAQIHRIQVEEAWLPRLREAYVADVETRLGKPNASERQLLEKALKSLDEEELASARLHARGKMSEEVWDSLWKDWQDQRNAIRQTLRAIDESCEIHIATLDDALKVIAKAGILFDKLERLQQRTLLQYMVKRVIVNPEGQILRMELRTPFNYLHSLIGDGSKTAPQAGLRGEENKTSRDNPAGSKFMSSGAPMGLSGHIRIQRTRRRAAGLSRALSPFAGSCAA